MTPLPNFYFTAPAAPDDPVTRPEPGDRVMVTLSGTVMSEPPTVSERQLHYVAQTRSGTLYMEDRDVEVLTVMRAALPQWRPGDVVDVQFTPDGDRFTYVRGLHDWSGDRCRKFDHEIEPLYRKGQVRHLLRNGEPVSD